VNKLLRSFVAFAKTDDPLFRVVIKATYHLDTKEPKEEYVQRILNYLKGTENKIDPMKLLELLLVRMIEGKKEWVMSAKTLMIFNRCLNEEQLQEYVGWYLKNYEDEVDAYKKKVIDTSAESKMNQEILQEYKGYILKLLEFKLDYKVQTTHLEIASE